MPASHPPAAPPPPAPALTSPPVGHGDATRETVRVIGPPIIAAPDVPGVRSRPTAPSTSAAAPAGSTVSPQLIGRSRRQRAFVAALDRVAGVDAPVLLLGETGTGKELAAARLHARSLRRDGPFVALNCASIAPGLVESELFGHVRGAFTGATRAHRGAFARACGGTLFLDEVGELPLAVQAGLLRVLEVRRFHAVGDEREQLTDARIIAATCRDLAQLRAQGRFREDLYHRLAVIELRPPPLRERPDDIPELIEHLAGQIARELARPITVTPAAVAAAARHGWPGNVRALRNALVRAAALHDGLITAAALLPPDTRAHPEPEPEPRGDRRPSPPPTAAAHPLDAAGPRWREAAPPWPAPAPAAPGLTRARPGTPLASALSPGALALAAGVSPPPASDFTTLRAELLIAAVERHGSIRRAAHALGLPRSTLAGWIMAARRKAAAAKG